MTLGIFKRLITIIAFFQAFRISFGYKGNFGRGVAVSRLSIPLRLAGLDDYKAPEDYRIGHGYDVHRLVAAGSGGKPLLLGAVTIPCEYEVIAHSDGDALLHAVCDAILGAIGCGDIGEHFDDTDPKNENLSSVYMLSTVLDTAKQRGYKVSNLDVTIMLQKPKLGAFKKMISDRVSDLLEGVLVNIKAKTAEGLGAIGSGLSIAVFASVLVSPYQPDQYLGLGDPLKL